MAAPAEPSVDYVSLFVDERRELLSFLVGVEAASWTAPTACPGWDFLDLVLHLVGDDFSILARHRDGHTGFFPPINATEAEFIHWLDDLQRTWVHAARRVSPRLAIDLLAWTGPQVVELFSAQNPSSVTAHVSWASDTPVPIWLDHARELSEYWIHRQQLRHAINLESDLRSPTVDAILDALRWAYPHRLQQLGRKGDTVLVRLTGDPSKEWTLIRDEAGWDLATTATASVPRATLDAGVDDGWRLLTNNLSDEGKPGVITTGDPAMTAVLLATRAIIGDPK